MPKTIVAIIVYNRFENLKLWLECWDKCDKENAELIVIHNTDRPPIINEYKDLCAKHNIEYINRPNIGLDIGALKELCRGTIYFDYENLIWITDDTIPMAKDFVKSFTSLLSDKVGLSCMEISNLRSPLHVRTTGFCITKQVAEKLVFPDQIVTKEDCYQFEHRGGKTTLMKQVEAMGLKCVMVSDLNKSPLWDTGNRAHLKRMAEHKKVFADKNSDKVVFICPVYNSYPEIISSLICQTHKNWELLLIHDGPNNTGLKDMIKQVNDSRIVFIETPTHRGNWGHYIRKEWLIKLKDSDADYIVITNADNYHVPTYTEYMVNGFTNNQAVATYCTSMVHSYINWGVIKCRLQRGYIDCASVMVKKDVACSIGWNDINSHSSDWTYFEDIIKKHGAKSFSPVNGCLLIHN